MEKKFFITTPIGYPDDIPNLTHAYSQIFADCVARYRRMWGESVFFLTGSDEHGQKVQDTAKAHRMIPQEFVDKMVEKFKLVWKKLDISYDYFIRTSQESHIKYLEEVFSHLLEEGDIYKGHYDGWYCVACETFLPFQNEGGCSNCNCPGKPERVKEDGYFFRLSSYIPQIIKYVEENENYIQPKRRRNEVLNKLKEGVPDPCVTRKGLIWGVPVPQDADYTIYVWMDALINYISAVSEDILPPRIQIVNRNILNFHGIIWTGLCMALGLPLPETIFAHGTVRYKTNHNLTYNLIELTDLFGADTLRFYLLSRSPRENDLEFFASSLTRNYNEKLANGLGNLISRSITMLAKFREGEVPQPYKEKDAGTEERNLERIFKQVKNEYKKSMDSLDFKEALVNIWDLIYGLNRYIDDTAPWDLHKYPHKKARLDIILYNLADYMRILTLMLYPHIPRSAEKIWNRLGFEGSLAKMRVDEIERGGFPGGQKVLAGEPLFPRIEHPPQG